jgi:hypothetical protein
MTWRPFTHIQYLESTAILAMAFLGTDLRVKHFRNALHVFSVQLVVAPIHFACHSLSSELITKLSEFDVKSAQKNRAAFTRIVMF